jgi:hypothetical protein
MSNDPPTTPPTSAQPWNFTPGNDGPADPATTSYFINHIALLVNDIEVSRKWYSEVLGMRHVFTFDVSEDYSVMYMAHAQGGRSGTGFQTGAELSRDKNNLAGMVEFLSYKVSANVLPIYEYVLMILTCIPEAKRRPQIHTDTPEYTLSSGTYRPRSCRSTGTFHFAQC